MATVLVVDDEFGIATLLKDVLEDENHRVRLATNGKDALEQISEGPPDLVLTDMMMPVMDGPSLIRALLDNPDFKSIPVIVMSSLPEATAKERCGSFAKFVRKPFTIFDIVDIVAEVLGTKSAS